MKYALFPGCLVQTEQYGYYLSVREVLPRLGVELLGMEGASCCGFPNYSVTSTLVWTYLTARNLALAERLGHDILTLCAHCHLSFCENQVRMEKDAFLKDIINKTLSAEGLEYRGERGIVHLLEVLYDIIGVKKIAETVVKPFTKLRIASHPGCHAFRPSDLKRPDESENPKKLDELIWALGAETYDYPERLDCCGSSTYLTDEEASLKIAGTKLKAVRDNGFDGLVTTCPHCFKAFDSKQHEIQSLLGEEMSSVPVFYYTQLLGLALNIAPEKLGIHLNASAVESLLS